MKKNNYFKGLKALVREANRSLSFLSIPFGIVLVPFTPPFIIRR